MIWEPKATLTRVIILSLCPKPFTFNQVLSILLPKEFSDLCLPHLYPHYLDSDLIVSCLEYWTSLVGLPPPFWNLHLKILSNTQVGLYHSVACPQCIRISHVIVHSYSPAFFSIYRAGSLSPLQSAQGLVYIKCSTNIGWKEMAAWGSSLRKIIKTQFGVSPGLS